MVSLCSFTRVDSCQPVWLTHALGQPEHGMWYAAFRSFGAGRGSFTLTSISRSALVGLWSTNMLKGRKYRAIRSEKFLTYGWAIHVGGIVLPLVVEGG